MENGGSIILREGIIMKKSLLMTLSFIALLAGYVSAQEDQTPADEPKVEQTTPQQDVPQSKEEEGFSIDDLFEESDEEVSK